MRGRGRAPCRMINYTASITHLMKDIVRRLPDLGFVDLDRVLVFARHGRHGAEGAYASCHSLNLPTSEPGYYFWRSRQTGCITRRSEWFVTKSPSVSVRGVPQDYLISFTLPRFANQSLRRSRKEVFYPGAPPWMAKLDTIVHELYHIDPTEPGIRRLERADGSCSPASHSHSFYAEVSRLVKRYLAAGPEPERYDFLQYSFEELTALHGGVVAVTFRTFPSYPQRYREAFATALEADPGVRVEPVKPRTRPSHYTEADLELRQFFDHAHPRRTSPDLLAPAPPAPGLHAAALAGAPPPSLAAAGGVPGA